MNSSRTVRVFLSSTFRDFAEERDLLVRKVFPELRRKCRERQVELVDVDLRWGITEKEAQQGKVLPICLAEIDRSRPFFMGFIGERYGWVPEQNQYDLSLVLEQPWLEEHRGGKSVTELEMLHGVLNNPAMEDRAFFYFRDPKWSKKKGGAYLSEGTAEKVKLEALKERIRKSKFPVVENYRTPAHLAERVREDLWKLIDEAFPENEVPDPLAIERNRHLAYGAIRRRLYIGGEKYFKALDEAMRAKPYRPVLITGQSGGGKSALVANWVDDWSKIHPRTVVIVHHLGCGADAADPVRMAVRIMQEIARVTGAEFKPESDPDKQLEQLPLWLAMASAWAQRNKKELLIVVDGLDKVSDRKHLRWFPSFLPRRLKFVASCLDGDILKAVKPRLKWREVKVRPFTKAEQLRFIEQYLGKFRKALTVPQARKLQDHSLSGNPLFLLTVLEELRVFGVHEQLESRLKTLLSPPASKRKGEQPTVDDAFEHVLARVEVDLGRKMVQGAMEAIWASRAGLFNDELLSIAKLAPAQWAAIHNALDETLYDSGGKINFSHYYLRKAVEDRYGLTGKKKLRLHCRLAEWFDKKKADDRVSSELPWQWRLAGKREKLAQCLLRWDIFGCCYDRDEIELLGHWLWMTKDTEAKYRAVWSPWRRRLTSGQSANLAQKLGGFLQTAGFYGNFTEKLHQIALCAEERGAVHPDTLKCLNNLAGLLRAKGDYSGAEAIHQQALAGFEKVFGSDHPYTLSSISNLSNVLADKGDYNGAEALYRRVLAAREKALGSDHPQTLASINNLASVLADKGDYNGAEALYRRALQGLEKVLGPEHLDTLCILSNLGNALGAKGDYGGAEALIRRSLTGYEKMLGAEHPDTLDSVNNLAALLGAKGDYRGAETLLRRTIAHREQALGVEHPDTLRSISNLGIILGQVGDNEGAEALFRRALAGYEKALGAEHPDTSRCVNNLADILVTKGDYVGAEGLYRRLMAILEKTLGADHPRTLKTARELGGLLQQKGVYEDLLRRVLPDKEDE